MKQLLAASAIALGLAGAAIAQDAPPAGTPMQGSPPYTNAPAPAASDGMAMAPGDNAMGNSTMAAPADKPMAGQANTPTDPNAPPMKKKKPR